MMRRAAASRVRARFCAAIDVQRPVFRSLGCRGRRSLGCAIVAQGFKGAATRVPEEATAFGLRRDHVLIETLQGLPMGGRSGGGLHRQEARATTVSTRSRFPADFRISLPAAKTRAVSHEANGRNAERLIQAERRYDLDNVFGSAPGDWPIRC
jgi:hypothetical protein